ncbi:MAG: shikimate dehydrogenase family protein [Longimicrobiales bacterium]
MNANAGTRLFVLLGDPVSHSLSPTIQNAAFTAAGLNAAYLALRCDSADVAPLVRAIARAGGGGNVTIPHKEIVVGALDVTSPAVRATLACNTFWFDGERVHGDNTDVEGFTAATLALVRSIDGIRAFVAGAGGGARAAVHALLEGGADHITVANRDLHRARALAAHLDATGRRMRTVALNDLPRERFDLVVNATSLGLGDRDALPFVLPALGEVGAVLDLVYRSGGSQLVHQAAALGIPARDGLDMLLAQGAAAFERWFKRRAPVDAMRAAVASAEPA